jgi:Ca2+-binding RTX toxin-like protein
VDAGTDTIDLSGSTRRVDVDLEAGTAFGQGFDRPGGFERVSGGPFDDTLRGSGAEEELLGRGGDDLLVGRSHDDTLAGGPGADTLHGGFGTDACDGGGGFNDVAHGCETVHGVP